MLGIDKVYKVTVRCISCAATIMLVMYTPLSVHIVVLSYSYKINVISVMIIRSV